ncbi:MAG: hypothetical protein ACPG4K_11525 [Haloferula sp.]
MSSSNPPEPVAPKSNGKPLIWVGTGCGVLLLIAVVGVAALLVWSKKAMNEAKATLAEVEAQIQAEAHAEMERQLELTETDPSKLADPSSMAAQGIDPSVIPDWVPRYPNEGPLAFYYHEELDAIVEGSFYFHTADEMEAVQKFYQEETSSFFEKKGEHTSSDDESRWTLKCREGVRELTVVVVVHDKLDDTLVIVTYGAGIDGP